MGRNVLDDIHEKYKRLPSTDIEQFAPVYYPIAIIEMNLDEMTFEDFESVQYSVLNLCSLGVLDYKVIAETLGLSPNYVLKILRLLSGYGHLDDKGITQVGSESIKAGKKIVKSQVWQKFQVDALNGTLLKVEQTVTENMLNDRDQTRMSIAHLDYLDGVSIEEISSQLTKNNCNNYIKQKSGILNTNVISVNEVRCVEVKYAKSYMMKLRNYNEPIIFAKRYDSNQKNVKDRFSWEPFSVASKSVLDRYGFEEDIPFSTDVARNYIEKLYFMMKEKAANVELIEEIPNTMELVYPFEKEGVEIVATERTVVPIVKLDARAFRKYRTWIINFLIGIHQDGEYLITNERLYGKIISLRTEDLKILDVAKQLHDIITVQGKMNVVRRLKDKFKDYEGEDNILDLIAKELKESFV